VKESRTLGGIGEFMIIMRRVSRRGVWMMWRRGVGVSRKELNSKLIGWMINILDRRVWRS
jgi:hypothetical protein